MVNREQTAECVACWEELPFSCENWRFFVPLGVEDAPEEWVPGVQYRLSVLLPGASDHVMAEFPFDVSLPPIS